jgi:hypothetical protein
MRGGPPGVGTQPFTDRAAALVLACQPAVDHEFGPGAIAGFVRSEKQNEIGYFAWLVDGDLKPIRAADRLGLTTRQVRRLARRYAAAGPVGLISKRFNRPSNNRLDDTLADQVIKILRSTYADFGPTLATEKLRTKHGIDLAKETVRQLQIAVGLWIPRKLRPPKIQQPRFTRARIGELIQIDGCEHHWFEDRGPACTALVFIDSCKSLTA